MSTTPGYVRADALPPVPPSGYAIAFAFSSATAGDAEAGAQVMLAHAQHAAGWSIGIDAAGRPKLTVGTTIGPVSVNLAGPIGRGRWYELVARIPGELPGRLELELRSADGGEPDGDADRDEATGGEATGDEAPASASVRLGAPIMYTRGPLLWGCRSLFDGRLPELPFDGRVAGAVLVPDAAAAGGRAELAAHPRAVALWDLVPEGGAEGRPEGGVAELGRAGTR